MPKNYNPSSGKSYQRVVDLRITYPTDAPPSFSFKEGKALLDSTGKPEMLAEAVQEFSFTLDVTKATDPIPMINPATGDVIPGQTTNLQQIMLVLTALTRKCQNERDSQNP